MYSLTNKTKKIHQFWHINKRNNKQAKHTTSSSSPPPIGNFKHLSHRINCSFVSIKRALKINIHFSWKEFYLKSSLILDWFWFECVLCHCVWIQILCIYKSAINSKILTNLISFFGFYSVFFFLSSVLLLSSSSSSLCILSNINNILILYIQNLIIVCLKGNSLCNICTVELKKKNYKRERVDICWNS